MPLCICCINFFLQILRYHKNKFYAKIKHSQISWWLNSDTVSRKPDFMVSCYWCNGQLSLQMTVSSSYPVYILLSNKFTFSLGKHVPISFQDNLSDSPNKCPNVDPVILEWGQCNVVTWPTLPNVFWHLVTQLTFVRTRVPLAATLLPL